MEVMGANESQDGVDITTDTSTEQEVLAESADGAIDASTFKEKIHLRLKVLLTVRRQSTQKESTTVLVRIRTQRKKAKHERLLPQSQTGRLVTRH